MKQFFLASLFFVTGLTASAQGSFSAQANALKQQYEKNKAMTRADGKEMPKASFVVICKADASPVAVGEQLKALGAEVNSVYGRCVAVTSTLPIRALRTRMVICASKQPTWVATPRCRKRK